MHQSSSPTIMEHGHTMEAATDNLTTTGHGLNMEAPEIVDFGGMIGQLGSAIIIIPLIAILESVAIAKAFGELKGGFMEGNRRAPVGQLYISNMDKVNQKKSLS